MARFRSVVWLLRGLTGSTPAVLSLDDGRFTLTVFGVGALARRHLRGLERDTGLTDLRARLAESEETVLFDTPLTQVEHIRFPWFYFGGGVHVQVRGVRYRLSFLQPQNTVADPALWSAREVAGSVAKGVSLGDRWRVLLTA